MKKYIIKCYSEEEMNRVADRKIEEGYVVERELSAVPVSNMFFPLYRVVFYEEEDEVARMERLNQYLDFILRVFAGMFLGLGIWNVWRVGNHNPVGYFLLAGVFMVMLAGRTVQEVRHKECKA